MLPDATVGEDLTVVWRRDGREWASSPAGVADDSSVEWDDACVQPVALRPAGTGWRPALCALEIRRVPRDAAGRPAGAGERVAAGALDVAQFCAAGGAPARPPRRVDLPLRPSGVLRVAVASRALSAGVRAAAAGGASAGGSPLTASPARSASGGASPRELPAAAAGDWEIRAVGSPHAGRASAAHASGTSSSTGGSSDAYLHRAGAGAATPGVGSAASARARSEDDGGAMPSEDDSLAPAPGGPSPDEGAVAALRRRVRRLERQREEARAEAFAESSERIQRGIEVEGLRRGRQALLARLAATEAQLVAAMRLDLEGAEDPQGGGGEALVRALVDAKVALAEREFECMELAGKLRAREAAAAALEAHLAAAQAAAADSARVRAPPPAADSPRRSWIGAKAAAGGSAGKATALAAAALAPLEREAGAPVIELRAVAGPARASPEA